MAWQRPQRWQNETMLLGPHRILGTLQNEMNVLGRQNPPWCLHGYELTALGWVGCMVRSQEVTPSEDA